MYPAAVVGCTPLSLAASTQTPRARNKTCRLRRSPARSRRTVQNYFEHAVQARCPRARAASRRDETRSGSQQRRTVVVVGHASSVNGPALFTWRRDRRELNRSLRFVREIHLTSDFRRTERSRLPPAFSPHILRETEHESHAFPS